MIDFEKPAGAHPPGRHAWLRWALICDDVRLEDSGKRLLIGAYSQRIIMSQRPTLLSLRLCGAFEIIPGGEHSVEFRVTSGRSQGLGKLQTTEEAEPGSYGEFNVPVVDLVEEAGTIQLDWRVDGGDWGPPMTWFLEFSEDAHNRPPEEVQALEEYWNSQYGDREFQGAIAGPKAVIERPAVPAPPESPQKRGKKA